LIIENITQHLNDITNALMINAKFILINNSSNIDILKNNREKSEKNHIIEIKDILIKKKLHIKLFRKIYINKILYYFLKKKVNYFSILK